MFGLSWSELVIIAIVTLVLVGPQDIPKVIKAISQAFNMAQKMGAEFRAHFNELAREVDIQELSKHLEVPKLDLERRIEDAVDPDKTIRDSFSPTSQQNRFESKSQISEVVSSEQTPPVIERRKEIWEEEANQHLLAQAPSLLPPRTALRLAEERKEWLRPAIIPPMAALHDGMRAVVVSEKSLEREE
ncbi:hypothetical protein FAI41_08465 [Acetobacteraceae bacterium]|nr:hypothetical protein FAI41_08465 [Acetobacteraceae bacterium]